jgi:sec-independent protein translocase protein TatB
MFDISWSEFLLIGIVALIVIGPKELPTVMRTLGQWTRKVRAMAADFQNQFQEAMREAEVADLKNEVDDLAHQVRSADPIRSVRDDFETMGSDFERALDGRSQQAPPADETAPVPTTPSAAPAPDSAEAANVETAETENATEPVAAAEPSTGDPAPAAADGACTPASQAATPRTRDDDTAGAPAAAQPVGETEPANPTGRTG